MAFLLYMLLHVKSAVRMNTIVSVFKNVRGNNVLEADAILKDNDESLDVSERH